MSTTAELFAKLNTLRVAAGVRPLKAWKESRTKLEQAISAYLDTPEKFEASQTELDAQKDRPKHDEPKQDEPVASPSAPKKRVTKDVEFKDSARKVKKGDIWLTEICEQYKLNPKVARAKMRRLYAGDVSGLPKLLGRWSWSSNDVAAVVKLLKK